MKCKLLYTYKGLKGTILYQFEQHEFARKMASVENKKRAVSMSAAAQTSMRVKLVTYRTIKRDRDF